MPNTEQVEDPLPSASPRTGGAASRRQDLVTAELSYRGYTVDRLALLEQPREHTDKCTVDPSHGWPCEDEEGRAQHPDHDVADDSTAVTGRACAWI